MIAALVVGCAGFVQAFDGNAVAIALPAMARGFAVAPLALGSVMTAYLVGAAVALPLCSWLAERLGARTLFLFAIGLFAATSLACGISASLVQLEITRLAQGCAGALLLPVGRIIVLGQASRGQMLRAMGMMTTPVMLGPLLGPPLGGLIVSALSWRWLFFLNVPIALAGIGLVWWRIAPMPPHDVPRPLDVRGTLLLSGALAMATYGIALAVRGATEITGLALAAGGLAAAGIYVLHARRHPAPVLSAHLFAHRSFSASNIGGLFPRLLVSALPFLFTLQLQVTLGLSAAGAGALVFASALGSLPARWSVGLLLARWSYRRVLGINTVLIAASVAGCALFGPATPHWLIIAALALQGLLRSTQLVAFMALGYAEVERRDMPVASTIASLSQQVAMSLGIALTIGAVELGGGGALGTARAFVIVALVSLASLAWILRLPPALTAPAAEPATPPLPQGRTA